MVQTKVSNFRIGRLGWLLAALALGWGFPTGRSFAVADEAQESAKRPVLFITVESPLTDAQVGRVRNAALTLQTEATQRKKQGLLFLEIQPGSSEFYGVCGLADWLTSPKISNVTTVAWVPKSVTGNNAILALGCREIVMAPEAELGDIGRGQVLEENRQKLVIDIVSKANNNKVSEALVRKMMDRNIELDRITLEKGKGPNATETTEIVTGDELKRLQDKKAVIKNTTQILDSAEAGVFTGENARRWDVLVTQTATSRKELADTYKLEPSDLREDPSIAGELNVRLIKVEGMIEPVMGAYIQRLINRAVSDGANMIIFEVDSPGGYMETMWELRYAITDLSEKKVRTVAYIPKIAMSAAAVISLSCDEIYMKPDAKIGDAGPITIGKGQAFERVPEKQLSAIRAELTSLAEKKHRPAALLEAMADRNLVVYEVRNKKDGHIWYLSEADLHKQSSEWEKVGVVPESEKDLLLTVTGKRAHELKLAEPPVSDIEELKQRLGIPAETKLEPMQENWVDTLIFKLNTPGWTGHAVCRRDDLPVPRTALDDRLPRDYLRLVLRAVLLVPLHGRHRGLARSDSVRRRPDLLGAGTVCDPRLRRVRHFRRADGAGFLDPRQPDLRRQLGPRHGKTRHHGQNIQPVDRGGDGDRGDDQPLPAPHPAVQLDHSASPQFPR